MNKSFAVRLLFFLLLSLTISCLSPSQQGERVSFFDYTDCYGNRVQLDSVPSRIISLSPAITEMVFMLDEGGKLVGISDFCHYPEATDTMHRVGGMQNINVESLVALNPDVVLIGSIVTKQDMEKMERAGLKVVVIREETKLEGLCDALEVIGNLLDKKELAEEQIQQIHNQLDSVKLHIDTTLAPKKVYYVVAKGEFTPVPGAPAPRKAPPAPPRSGRSGIRAKRAFPGSGSASGRIFPGSRRNFS